MSIVDPGPELRPDARVATLDTTEVRWFFNGAMPPDVGEWFTRPSGVAEERCDTYLLDGRADVGVKRRHGETLELKVRQSLADRIELRRGLVGELEIWRKWSPAEGLVVVGEHADDSQWRDVHKSVVKRRFSASGTEIDFSREPQLTGAGCDVEIAEVTVGTVRWWTFAFAAFGPEATRRDALLASWQALSTGAPDSNRLGSSDARAMGYPEWLEGSMASRASTAAARAAAAKSSALLA